jgi:taurine dioxygenase
MSGAVTVNNLPLLSNPNPNPLPNSLARLSIESNGSAVGAIVRGIDLAQPIAEDIAQRLRDAWQEHLVLLFPEQYLEPAGFLNAANVFGTPQEGANRRYIGAAGIDQDNQYPAIMLNTNLDADGKPVRENDGLGSLEVVWHSDNSYIEEPPVGSMLYALEAPRDSGLTSFSNQYLAYEGLSDGIKARIKGRWAKHDASRNSAGMLRPGIKTPERPEDVPGPFHPMVIRNPESGRECLYLGRRRIFPSQFIEGLPIEESEELLDILWAAATRDELTWTHVWSPGDVLLWDNRYVMHHRTPISETQRRIMIRTQFEGRALLPASPRLDV